MKKALTILLVFSMVFSMVACSGQNAKPIENTEKPTTNDGVSEEVGGPTAEVKMGDYKLGMLDLGAWNAVNGPMMDQAIKACEALGVEVYLQAYERGAEGVIAAVQNMIAAGCDGLVLPNMPLLFGCIPQIAEICDDAGVLWSMAWTKVEEGDGNYEACMNSETFVCTFYEDDEYGAYVGASKLGDMGCKNICEIGMVSGNATGDMRDAGIARALEEYDMKLVADERDMSLTSNADGGKTIMDRFITSHPEIDGLMIAGMSQFVLSGVVAAIEERGLTDEIEIASMGFHEYQAEYLKSGILDVAVGGYVCGMYYSIILMVNQLNGTPLTDEKVIMEDNNIYLTNYEDALLWDEYGLPGNMYSAEETRNAIVAFNPDYTFEDFCKMVEAYSLEDIVARASK